MGYLFEIDGFDPNAEGQQHIPIIRVQPFEQPDIMNYKQRHATNSSPSGWLPFDLV